MLLCVCCRKWWYPNSDRDTFATQHLRCLWFWYTLLRSTIYDIGHWGDIVFTDFRQMIYIQLYVHIYSNSQFWRDSGLVRVTILLLWMWMLENSAICRWWWWCAGISHWKHGGSALLCAPALTTGRERTWSPVAWTWCKVAVGLFGGNACASYNAVK